VVDEKVGKLVLKFFEVMMETEDDLFNVLVVGLVRVFGCFGVGGIFGKSL
jgi:hypothetical protein